MKKPPVVDAKFRVVRGPQKLPPWNGVGLPPEWPQWPLISKVIFAIGAPAAVIGLFLFFKWFVAQIVG